MISSDAVMAFTPLAAGFLCILAGCIWMYIEGMYARKEFTKKNESRSTRIVVATVIATLGIVIVTISGFLLISV
jgi:hypothetical protein